MSHSTRPALSILHSTNHFQVIVTPRLNEDDADEFCQVSTLNITTDPFSLEHAPLLPPQSTHMMRGLSTQIRFTETLNNITSKHVHLPQYRAHVRMIIAALNYVQTNREAVTTCGVVPVRCNTYDHEIFVPPWANGTKMHIEIDGFDHMDPCKEQHLRDMMLEMQVDMVKSIFQDSPDILSPIAQACVVLVENHFDDLWLLNRIIGDYPLQISDGSRLNISQYLAAISASPHPPTIYLCNQPSFAQKHGHKAIVIDQARALLLIGAIRRLLPNVDFMVESRGETQSRTNMSEGRPRSQEYTISSTLPLMLQQPGAATIAET
eukprot:1387218-Amphidinium_carterae.2